MTSADLSAIRDDLAATMEHLRAIEARLGGDAAVDDGAGDLTEWITVDKAAGFAGISQRQMWRWIEQGRVRSEVTPSGRRRVDKASAMPAPAACRKMS